MGNIEMVESYLVESRNGAIWHVNVHVHQIRSQQFWVEHVYVIGCENNNLSISSAQPKLFKYIRDLYLMV
jgi:hypothetical protein